MSPLCTYQKQVIGATATLVLKGWISLRVVDWLWGPLTRNQQGKSKAKGTKFPLNTAMSGVDELSALQDPS